MKISWGIGLILVVAAIGCGSDKSPSTLGTTWDAASAGVDGVAARSDLPPGVVSGTDAAPVVVPTGSDAAGVAQGDAAVLPPASDAAALSPASDAAVLLPASDAAPVVPGTTVVASKSTPDDNADPATCSTVVLGIQTFSADKAYDIEMPDCHRVSGTITLADPLPAGAVFANGAVNAFKVIRDGTGRVSDTVSYAATVTAVDNTHFRYSMSVPADTYEMSYHFIVKSGALIPSTANRIGQEQLTVGQSALKHDVTLPAIDVATVTVTVTGTDALPSNGNLFGRFLQVMGINQGNTLMVSGFSMTAGASVPISMWVPRETVTPTLMVQESPGAMAPYASGHVSQFRLAPVTPAGDFSLALPATAKISGTISDPNHSLSPMMGIGGSGTSAVSYYHCNSLDTGTFPNPIFFYPEGSTSSYFSAATSHAFYVRKGLTCVTYANYAIATGAPGATPSRAGENTYAFMEDPTPKSTDGVAVNADLLRNITVPNLGPQVTITGTVKDARGKGIANAELSVVSRTLVTAAVANNTFVGGLDVGANGAYTLHVLPGTYDVRVELPTSPTTTPPTPDAGTSTGGDAAWALPDVSFTFPDLGAGGDCSTLAPCCATLIGNNKTMCDAAVTTGQASTCNSILTLLRMGGSCS